MLGMQRNIEVAAVSFIRRSTKDSSYGLGVESVNQGKPPVRLFS